MVQTTLADSPEIEAGLASGLLERSGSVVRNQSGQIVKQLDEVVMPAKAAEKVLAVARKSRVPVIAVGVPLVLLGGVAVATAITRKRQRVTISDAQVATQPPPPSQPTPLPEEEEDAVILPFSARPGTQHLSETEIS